MNTTTSRTKGGRLVASLVAAGIVAASSLGIAAPAMAAPDASNINQSAIGSIVVHKLQQPATGTVTPTSTGSALTAAQTQGLVPIDGVTFQAQRVTSLDLSKSSTWANLSTLSASTVIANPSTYPLGTATSATTANGGVATLGNLQVGVYLVRETSVGSNSIAVQSAPFLVSIPLPEAGKWVYDVHVYPKNSMTGISLAINDAAAYGLGGSVHLTATTTVPYKVDGAPITSYVVTDQLDATRLTYTDGSVVVKLDGTALTLGTDYKVDFLNGLVTVTLLQAGLDKVNLTANGGKSLTVEFDAKVIALGDGTIENTAGLNINNRTTPIASNEVVTSWGALKVVKHPSTDATQRLAGAVFEVRRTTGEVVSVNGQTQWTTGENGEFVVPGLRAGSYNLVEVQAPVGYVLNPTPIPVTVTTGTTAQAATYQVANTQVPAFALPVTGGDGQVAFMVGGGALLIIAAGAFLVTAKRRRAEQDA